jgi:hypothetical protein
MKIEEDKQRKIQMAQKQIAKMCVEEEHLIQSKMNEVA